MRRVRLLDGGGRLGLPGHVHDDDEGGAGQGGPFSAVMISLSAARMPL
jgi:hypothetical protein